MQNKGMLGDNEVLREFLSGPFSDFTEKLNSENGERWLTGFKRFLRKENPWPAGLIQAVPFDPVALLGKGWSIEEQDERSLALNEIDLSKVSFETCLKQGEASITGEKKLKRLKTSGHIRLDARFFLALWKNQKLIPESWKEKTNGSTTEIFFDGTVLRRPVGYRDVLYLFWRGGQWRWGYYWLDCGRAAYYPSVVLASAENLELKT